MVLTLRVDTNISRREVNVLASYKEIIQEQRSRMPVEINWWPRYLYHYTDVNHAVSIIGNEWIYDRVTAEKKRLTKTDAASQNVLNVTSDAVKHCGRLYMRPLTPTQFYSEGYKPKVVRHENYKDANCPVPVFFLLDAVKTLKYPDVFFVERGAAGLTTERWKTGKDEFAKLDFEKIFHHGSEGYTSSIGQYRRTEVLRESGIPLCDLLKRIVCRSPAEERTLLSLMREQCPAQYKEYSRLIMTAPADIGRYMFNYSGIYIKKVKAKEDQVLIEFNEARLRYDRYERGDKDSIPVALTVAALWKSRAGKTIGQKSYEGILDYKVHNAVVLNYKDKMSDYLMLKIQLDGNLVFQDDFYIGNQGIVY